MTYSDKVGYITAGPRGTAPSTPSWTSAETPNEGFVLPSVPLCSDCLLCSTSANVSGLLLGTESLLCGVPCEEEVGVETLLGCPPDGLLTVAGTMDGMEIGEDESGEGEEAEAGGWEGGGLAEKGRAVTELCLMARRISLVGEDLLT